MRRTSQMPENGGQTSIAHPGFYSWPCYKFKNNRMRHRLILYDKAWKAFAFQAFISGPHPAITSKAF
jgi:hypothetical protein